MNQPDVTSTSDSAFPNSFDSIQDEANFRELRRLSTAEVQASLERIHRTQAELAGLDVQLSEAMNNLIRQAPATCAIW